MRRWRSNAAVGLDEVDPVVRQRERRNSAVYLTGLATSMIGTSAMSLAAGIWVKTLTGSSSAATVVSVCVYLPTLFGPLAGLIADRVRCRTLLIVVNLAAGVVMLPLLLVRSAGQVWLVELVMLGAGIVATLSDPAESKLFVLMLSGPARQRINGMRLALGESGKLVAPLLGAGLFAVVGGGAVAALDAATFVFAGLMTMRLRVDIPAPQPQAGHWRSDLLAGIRHIARTPRLRTVLIAGTVAMAASGTAVAAGYGLIDGLHRSPSFLGVLSCVIGAGSITAGLVSNRMINRFGETGLAVFGLLDGVSAYLLRATGWLPAVLVGSLFLGFALPWTVAAVINLAQRLTPAELQGRVAAAVTLALFAPQPLMQSVGALTIGPLGFRVLYLAVAAITLLNAIRLMAATRSTGQRSATTGPSQDQTGNGSPAGTSSADRG